MVRLAIGCGFFLLLVVFTRASENDTVRLGREYRVDSPANDFNSTDIQSKYQPMPSKLPKSSGKASWIPIQLWSPDRVGSSSVSHYNANNYYHIYQISLALVFAYLKHI